MFRRRNVSAYGRMQFFLDFVYQKSKIDNVEKPFKERQTILIGGKPTLAHLVEHLTVVVNKKKPLLSKGSWFDSSKSELTPPNRASMV